MERLGGLVEDLVELSQVAIGPERRDVPPTMLIDAVVDAMAGARAQAERRGVRFTDRVGELPEMELGAHELTTALRDLLDDAIRRSSPGATVLVESFVDAGGVTVAVTDECGGPHERHLTRVFDVAYRSHPARRRADDSPAVAEASVGAHRRCVEEADRSPSCCFTVRLGRLA